LHSTGRPHTIHSWFYLITILDDFSRYIVAWKLCTTMKAGDVTETLNLALQASKLDQVHVVHRPRLLSDNRLSYISAELAESLGERNIGHVRGAPCHPQIQGKIERWHQMLKKTVSCWRITIFPMISKPKSPPSSSAIIIAVITRA
jgi:putative transposase